MSREEDRKKRKQKQDAWLEAMIMDIMKKSAKAAMEAALDEILGEWKKKLNKSC